MREAIGQLFDYQRYYDRSPSLALLLPKRPLPTMMELFGKKRIAVIWQTPKGQFRDSLKGAITTELRKIAKTAT